jgi:hypothetical protein
MTKTINCATFFGLLIAAPEWSAAIAAMRTAKSTLDKREIDSARLITKGTWRTTLTGLACGMVAENTARYKCSAGVLETG